MIKVIEWEALRKLILQRSIKLIDVREPAEFFGGNIPTSVNVPLSTLSTALALVVPEKQTPMVFYCMSGMRSAKAVEWALQAGYSDVQSYKGSWNEYSKLSNDQKVHQE